MQNRVDIKDFIVQIEQDFSINEWQVNGIHLWPIIRIKLFFYLINKVEFEGKAPQNKTNISPQKKSLIRNLLYRFKRKLQKLNEITHYLLWKNNLPKKDYIFLGGDLHRVTHNNSRFNRFFDVLIDQHGIQDQALYLEYGSQIINNQYHSEAIYFYEPFYKGYQYLNPSKNNKAIFKWNGFLEFRDFLFANELTKDFIKQNEISNLEYWAIYLFLPKITFFKTLLKKIQPKQIHFLCYYSEFNYALLVAANQAKIVTVEMQHGPHTDIHLCYGSWSNIPENGYDVLPRVFWNWDENSTIALNKWMHKNTNYKLKIIGNPWLDYWIKNSKSYPHKDFILYSLQPNPITLDQLFTPQLLECIRSGKEVWFIRLHPRQFHEMEAIISLLKKENLIDKVNIKEATQDPLPQLLANAKLHVTHSSGTALEAVYFGLKTVLINEIGLTSFPELLAKQQAVYIHYLLEDFELKFKNYLAALEEPENNTIFDTPITSNLFS
ncbi:hypothetical protein [Flavobacterium sp.]|uniref:hypothetical protein n=1 Tax=Flavobacterium sp. TaxID=239 RepID=UPI00404849BB